MFHFRSIKNIESSLQKTHVSADISSMVTGYLLDFDLRVGLLLIELEPNGLSIICAGIFAIFFKLTVCGQKKEAQINVAVQILVSWVFRQKKNYVI